jgi:hypothetical protein
MKVKDLRNLLENLDGDKKIVINVCVYERVESIGREILELYGLGDGGYILELKGEE